MSTKKSNQALSTKNICMAIGLAMVLCAGGAGATDQSPADQLRTKTVGLAIKACMKAYLANSDFQSLKNAKIVEINRMPEPQFNADYNQAWAVIKQCPGLVSKYRLRVNTSKQEALKIIGGLTRNDCLAAVDEIPDEVIVDQFDKCMGDPEIQNMPLNEQINLIMNRSISGKGK